jgi:hypothetical protein
VFAAPCSGKSGMADEVLPPLYTDFQHFFIMGRFQGLINICRKKILVPAIFFARGRQIMKVVVAKEQRYPFGVGFFKGYNFAEVLDLLVRIKIFFGIKIVPNKNNVVIRVLLGNVFPKAAAVDIANDYNWHSGSENLMGNGLLK